MSNNMSNEIKAEDLVATKAKVGYSLTALGSQLVHGIFLISLVFYYREQLLLPEIYIIIAFGFYAIWNAINDPLFGWLSDKTNTRWGRRIPYYWIFVPVMTVSFLLLWVGPSTTEVSDFIVFLWLLITMCMYDTAFTAVLLVWSALGQEMSMDHRVRANIQIYTLIFGLAGTLVALILPMLFLEQAGRGGFIFLAIILAIIQFITMMTTSFTVKEKLEFSQVDKPLGLVDAVKHTFKSKSFIIAVTMNFGLIFTQSILYGNLFFYTYYAIPGYDSFLLLLIIVAALLIGIVVGIIYIVRINDKKGVKTAMLHSILWQGIGFLLIGILPGILSVIGFFFVGIGIFGAMTLFNAAFGEVADEDEVKTGTRREAAIFGINALITKPAESLGNALIALMLLIFLYQEPIGGTQQPQSDFTILGIKIAMGIIPGIVCFLAFLIFRMSPLHGDYLKEVKTKMSQMHQEKKEKLRLKMAETNKR
jgi:GPH family glycoside/pentoside/hexuronide:cation symporter